MERRLAAIFALDMVGYSRLMGADESGTLSRQKTHRTELIDPCIEKHHGRVVKGTGDGLLAEFASAVDAVECAAEIQRAMPDREKGSSPDVRILFRIGINVGDIVAEDGDIYGDGVNVAARIEALADHGGVFISGSAFSQVRGKVELGFEDQGFHAVKNIEEPVRVYRVLLDPEAAGLIPGARKQGILKQLLRRRVPHFLGLYLVGSWAFLEFVDFAVRQYGSRPCYLRSSCRCCSFCFRPSSGSPGTTEPRAPTVGCDRTRSSWSGISFLPRPSSSAPGESPSATC